MQPPRIALPAPMQAALESHYASPPRAYHHFGHVQAVFVHFDEVTAGPGWSRPEDVAMAVLYHDAIYQPGRSDNEARSADLAREHIARWLPGSDVDAARVSELIALTARHGQLSPGEFGSGPEADDTRRFLDCDMAILGAPPEAFTRYDRAIAEEYRGVVPGWIYRRKRRAFLRGLLKRERIFLSEFFHQRLDAQARINLQHAVSAQ